MISLLNVFSHILKDDALKWYFTLPKKNIDKYEYLIHEFLNKFKYNIQEKAQYKYFYRTKKLINQSLTKFVIICKKVTNKITTSE